MAERLPLPVPPPTSERFTVWCVPPLRDVWFAVRSFDGIEEARLFAKCFRGRVLITHQRTTHEFLATVEL